MPDATVIDAPPSSSSFKTSSSLFSLPCASCVRVSRLSFSLEKPYVRGNSFLHCDRGPLARAHLAKRRARSESTVSHPSAMRTRAGSIDQERRRARDHSIAVHTLRALKKETRLQECARAILERSRGVRRRRVTGKRYCCFSNL